MLQEIEKASENFCIHQIRKPHTLHEGITKTRTLIAYIDINAKDTKSYRVYIAASSGFVQEVSRILLEEDESDDETLQDMTLEMTNLIVGSAKVIALEKDQNPFTIGTPCFEKYEVFDLEYDDARTIVVEEHILSIAIKELNA